MQGLVAADEAVVNVGVLGGVDADEVGAAFGLQHGLNNDLLMAVGQLQELVQVLLLYPVEISGLNLLIQIGLDFIQHGLLLVAFSDRCGLARVRSGGLLYSD